MIYWTLFWEFFKTGLFAIGGGMATVPFLQDIAAKTGWYTSGQLADMIAVSESTPGPIGVNMATYVGYTVGSQSGTVWGILGAVIATIGLITPSVLVILLVSYFLARFRTSKTVDAALYGLRPASVALISTAGIQIVLFSVLHVEDIFSLSQARISWPSLVLAALILYLTRWVKPLKKLHPIWFILFSAVAGILLGLE